ncbi:MAG: dTDP-4-dehydrorhamnose 3,5-epimerase [Deltaproteobacteria bacterium RIFCSPLOWO2_02_FULL_47_10]|nr:MAG: dTDP-4-dehydrorhamnose 3,5-epimerase [Deltaproteobacteria bacterium RIFCSPLOWO2_02_FULL_47_10]
MSFRNGVIEGVVVRKVEKYRDRRGWLVETFRKDEAGAFRPAMSHISMTHAGVSRGPHEHNEQTDYFFFLGSTFSVVLWDNREGSPTYKTRMIIEAGDASPSIIIIPPRVVHGYRNIGRSDGFVINYPDRLYAGRERKKPADEVRHEDDPSSFFAVDFNRIIRA